MLITRFSARLFPLSGLAIGLTLSAGCAKNDRADDAFGQKGLFNRQAARPEAMDTKDMPLADMPKILPQTHYAAGRLFESQGQIGKAVEQYRKALLVNHHFPECHHRLARMLSLAKQHDEALTHFAAAVERKPENAAYRNDLAFALMYHERWEEAERQLRKAVELEPRFVRAYVNLGLALSRQGRFDEALSAFRTVLPEPDAQYNLGLMYRGQTRYAEAAECFRQVLAINPEFPAARVQLDQMIAKFDGQGDAEQVAQADSPDVKIEPATAMDTPESGTAAAAEMGSGVAATAGEPQLSSPQSAASESPADQPLQSDKSDSLAQRAAAAPAPRSEQAIAAAAQGESSTAPASNEDPWGEIEVVETQGSPVELQRSPESDGSWAINEAVAPEASGESTYTDPFLDQLRTELAQLQTSRGHFETTSQSGKAGIEHSFDDLQREQPTIEFDRQAISERQLEQILLNEANCIEEQADSAPMHTATTDATIAAERTASATETDTTRAAQAQARLEGFVPLSTGPICLTAAQNAPAVMGPPADPAAELILAAFAKATVARSQAVVERHWREGFNDLIRLAEQSRNERLCWQDLDERTRTLLASWPAAPRPRATDWPVVTNEINATGGGPAALGSPTPANRN